MDNYMGARAAMGCYGIECCSYIAVTFAYLALHVAMALWSLWPSMGLIALATSSL